MPCRAHLSHCSSYPLTRVEKNRTHKAAFRQADGSGAAPPGQQKTTLALLSVETRGKEIALLFEMDPDVTPGHAYMAGCLGVLQPNRSFKDVKKALSLKSTAGRGSVLPHPG